MNDQQMSAAYGLAAIVIALVILAGLAAQQVWLVFISLFAITAWTVTGFMYDIWKDSDE
ncbi:hypothetical protein [Siphovirus Jomon_CT89]|nr:hypothetical protein [Siphovirus Jomon_CT89]